MTSGFIIACNKWFTSMSGRLSWIWSLYWKSSNSTSWYRQSSFLNKRFDGIGDISACALTYVLVAKLHQNNTKTIITWPKVPVKGQSYVKKARLSWLFCTFETICNTLRFGIQCCFFGYCTLRTDGTAEHFSCITCWSSAVRGGAPGHTCGNDESVSLSSAFSCSTNKQKSISLAYIFCACA